MSADTTAIVQDSMARIRRNAGDFEAWSQLFMVFAQARDQGNIEGLVNARQNLLGDGLGFFYYVMRDLMAMRLDPVALAIAERLGPDHVLSPVALYMRGLAAARQERSDATVALIREAVRQAEQPALRGFAERDRLFNNHAGRHMATEAGLLLDAAESLSLETAPAAPPPVLHYRGAPPAAGAESVLLAACDKGYFARFAEGFVRSVGQATGGRQRVHLHVVGPDAETEQAIDALMASHDFLRVSTEPGLYRAAYYACSRFLVLRTLLDRYRTTIITADIDIALLKPLDALVAAMADADLGWFEAGKQLPLPTLFCDCRLTAFADTPASRRTLGLFERYIRAKYAEGVSWMIDQGGLWSLSRALGGAIRRVDFATRLGPDYAGLLAPVEDAKTALRTAADAEAAGRP